MQGRREEAVEAAQTQNPLPSLEEGNDRSVSRLPLPGSGEGLGFKDGGCRGIGKEMSPSYGPWRWYCEAEDGRPEETPGAPDVVRVDETLLSSPCVRVPL